MTNSKHSKQCSKPEHISRIREIVNNTKRNFKETENSKEFADPLQRELMIEKNDQRKQSIEELKAEMKDEIANMKKGKNK